MKIISKPIRELTQEEYDACKACSHGPNGGMCATLPIMREAAKYRSKAVMVWDGPVLVGWALLVKLKDDRTTMQIYVRSSYRNQGIARKIVGRVMQGRKEPVTCYDSWEATKLYSPLVKSGRLRYGSFWEGDFNKIEEIAYA